MVRGRGLDLATSPFTSQWGVHITFMMAGFVWVLWGFQLLGGLRGRGWGGVTTLSLVFAAVLLLLPAATPRWHQCDCGVITSILTAETRQGGRARHPSTSGDHFPQALHAMATFTYVIQCYG